MAITSPISKTRISVFCSTRLVNLFWLVWCPCVVVSPLEAALSSLCSVICMHSEVRISEERGIWRFLIIFSGPGIDCFVYDQHRTSSAKRC